MRLEGLTLDCYGCFLSQDLALDPGPGRINLLVAPNGAGKSVLRAAFSDLLFGIDHQSPMTFAHPSARLRLTARVRLPDGGVRVVIRRKGVGNTLADGATAIAPEAWRGVLGGADERLFRDLFALDSEALREGGEALSHAAGRLGRMLLAGSGGLGPVQRLLEGLVRDRDAIGRADHRHIARPLWRAAREAADAGRVLAEVVLRPDAWHGLEKRAEAAESALAVLRDERIAVDAELARLRTLQAVRPWLARRDTALAVLAAAEDVPRLEQDFEARWRRAVEDNTRAVAAAGEARRQAAEAASALDGPAPDATLLQAAKRIEAVLREGVKAANAAADLPEVEARHHQGGLEAARLRRELGWDAAVKLPTAPTVRAARALLGARTGKLAIAEDATRELATARQGLERAEQALAALPPAEDTTALAGAVREIRAGGDPSLRLEAARRARRDAEAALAASLAAVPERALTRALLAATTAPAEPVLAAREQALTEAEAASRDATRERDGLARQRADAEVQLAALSRDAALPEPGALAAARAARDRLWDGLRTGGDADPVGFERALRHADAVADALIAHATEAAKAEELRRGLEDLASREAAADGACAAEAERLQAARAGLAALAEAAGAAPLHAPGALRSFLAARGVALERAVAFDRASAEEADLHAALQAAARRLEALGAAGDSVAARLEAAESRIAAAQANALARTAAMAELRKARRAVADRAGAETASRQDMQAWEASWCAAAGKLARPADETPEATAAALDLIEPLREQETAGAGDAARIQDMQGAIESFAAAIAALCAGIAPDLAPLPPQEAAARLERQLQEQRAAAVRREAQQRAHETACRNAAEADEKARATAAALVALRAALGVADDEAASAKLERVRAVAAASADLAEARRHLPAQGGGRSEAELDAMTASSTADAEAARIGVRTGRQAELGPLIEAAAAAARSAADEWSRAGQGEDVQEAAARREAALATLGRHAEEALVLHAAASLLRVGLEAGREVEGSATVARIGTVFRELTCGAYANVAVVDDGTDRMLVAVEADGVTNKRIDELSQGTSDQLFLALRVVALEDYVQASPALPFIADDVLQTFDDERAAAALRALLELSGHVQVIVLTHHPHVQALARSLPAEAVHTVMLADAA